MNAAPSPASPNPVPPRTAEVHQLVGSTPPGASQPFAVVTDDGTEGRVRRMIAIERRLAAAGVPLARMLLEAGIARSTWARWCAGGMPRADRWAAAVHAIGVFEVAQAEAEPSTADAPPAAPPADREDWRSRLVPLIRREDRLSRADERIPGMRQHRAQTRRGAKLWIRMTRRITRWTQRLAAEPAHDARSAAIKADIYIEFVTAGWSETDKAAADRLGLAVARDTLHLGTARAELNPGRAMVDMLGARHPDAEMLALGRSWEASCGRYERAVAAEDALVDTRDLIAPPRALAARPGDVEATYCTPTSDDPTNPFEGPWYGRWDRIDNLRRLARQGQPNARRDEILNAYDRWRADVAAEDVRSGLSAARAERKLATDENAALRGRMCLMPARTPAGVDLKLRMLLWLHDGLAGLEEAMEPKNVDDPHYGASIALSMALDLARTRLGLAAPPGPAVAVDFAWVA